MDLAKWNDRLTCQFSEVRQARQARGTDLPIFALEHGLTEGLLAMDDDTHRLLFLPGPALRLGGVRLSFSQRLWCPAPFSILPRRASAAALSRRMP